MLLLHTGKSRFDVDGLCWTRFENVGHIYRDGTTCSQPSARVTHHCQYSQRLAEICEIKWRDVVLVAHRAIRRISHAGAYPRPCNPYAFLSHHLSSLPTQSQLHLAMQAQSPRRGRCVHPECAAGEHSGCAGWLIVVNGVTRWVRVIPPLVP